MLSDSQKTQLEIVLHELGQIELNARRFLKGGVSADTMAHIILANTLAANQRITRLVTELTEGEQR